MKVLNENYWQNRYVNQQTGWDIGYASTPIKHYAEGLTDKDLKILIPGAGNAYEAAYFFEHGFKNIHILDFAKQPLEKFKKEHPDFPEAQVHLTNFFDHQQQYDLIIEQTFFCALSPVLRKKYVAHTANCLNQKGKLVGLLFDFPLTNEGPPYGGSYKEYKDLFTPLFHIRTLERSYNSIKPRMTKELFFIFEKKQQ
jgi:hypothetical protein